MSKQMRGAYTALRMKDALNFFASTITTPMIAVCAIALLLCNTAFFHIALIVASIIASVWLAIRLVAFVCDRRIVSLGFTEVELERLGLA